ncbi:MAG TPA: amidohydrolase [Myxococcota bacterium]|nr:amidohydrolase [Myxococcota bacterium]
MARSRFVAFGLAALTACAAWADDLRDAVDRAARAVEPQVIAWRRDIHEHPELANREVRTAALVAKQLKKLGLAVRTKVAHTGVVAVLRGTAAHPVVALRADMDALPVTEETGLPFASRVRTTYQGQEVGVMHACGHDAHTAILLGVAEVLAGVRDRLPGTVLFVFQPAEEGAPPGERGGASLMLEEGAFDDPVPDVVYGLHVTSFYHFGEIGLVPGAAMASSDRLTIAVKGRSTHAAYPWKGVDPIPVAAQIVLALEALPARQVDARIPSVVSFGAIQGGVRHNIIPDQVELSGTIRALAPDVREQLHERIRRTARAIAEAAGATADVVIDDGNPVTWNDPDVALRIRPTLERVAGPERVIQPLPWTGAEDFAFYLNRVPGAFFFVGIDPPGVDPANAEPNHSPRFTLDEAALEVGVRALAHLAVDTLTRPR